jgi:hypothetical protein
MNLHKGLDDLLAAGGKPHRLKGPEVDAFFAATRARLFAPPDPEVVPAAVAGEATPEHRPPFPVEVFPQAVAGFARRVAAAMGCPLDFIGLAVLVISGAAVGAARSLQVKGGWFEKPGLYAVIVSRPGTTKTPALRAVMQPLYEEQDRLYQEHKAAVRQHKQDVEAYKQAQRNQEPGAGPPEEPPPLRHLFASDTTVEELANNLKDNPKGVLLFRDELTAWVRGMDMYRGKGTDRQFYLSAWTGEMVKVDRKLQHGRPVVIRHPFVSVLGGIQPDLLDELQAQDGKEDGFIHRVLFSFPPEAAVSGWLDDEISQQDEEGWKLVLDRLLNTQPVKPPGSSEVPARLQFNAEGRQAFKQWVNGLTAQMNAASFPPELVGPCSKLRAYCARFSLVLHLLRVACGEAGSDQDEGSVDATDVGGAIQLCAYFQAHLRAVYLRLRQTVQDRQVEGLVEWMRRKNKTTCTVREVQRAGVCGVARASDAQKLLAAAVDQGVGDWQGHTFKGGPEVKKTLHAKETPVFMLKASS